VEAPCSDYLPASPMIAWQTFCSWLAALTTRPATQDRSARGGECAPLRGPDELWLVDAAERFSVLRTVYWWLLSLVRRLMFNTIHDIALMDRPRTWRTRGKPPAAIVGSQLVKAPVDLFWLRHFRTHEVFPSPKGICLIGITVSSFGEGTNSGAQQLRLDV